MKIGATPLEFIELGMALYLVLALLSHFKLILAIGLSFLVRICVNFKVLLV